MNDMKNNISLLVGFVELSTTVYAYEDLSCKQGQQYVNQTVLMFEKDAAAQDEYLADSMVTNYNILS